jgi:DNA-binding response OmpR family regulator
VPESATEVVPVLVASADEGTRSQVRLTLGDERFAVREAADTDGAIQTIVEAGPRLLVLDLTLPGAGALAIARTMAQREGAARPQVLVLVPRGEAPPADAVGVDATLVVPTTSFALLHKVDGLLDGS